MVLLHGNNFAGFYFGVIIDALKKEGFRVVVPDQIGYGRSSKPIIPYNFTDMARNTRAILQSLKIDKAMIVGHSMGGMLAARFATQYPDVTERLVLFNPIGLTDGRFDRPYAGVDEPYKQNLASTYQGIRASLMRYVAHNPAAWNSMFETYARIRYGWTLGADWPRLAMVQTLISNVNYLDPVVYDWAHIKSPTLVYGGAEDYLAGTPGGVPGADEIHRRDHPEREREAGTAARPRACAVPRGRRSLSAAARHVPQGRGQVGFMSAPRVAAVLDMGATAIRLVIAEIAADDGPASSRRRRVGSCWGGNVFRRRRHQTADRRRGVRGARRIPPNHGRLRRRRASAPWPPARSARRATAHVPRPDWGRTGHHLRDHQRGRREPAACISRCARLCAPSRQSRARGPCWSRSAAAAPA